MLNKFLRLAIASILALACIHVAAAGWTSVNALATARSGHTSTLLPSGKILIAGGATGVFTNAAELFDPATGQWQATGNMREARLFHTATLLHTGKVLVTGGVSASAELYDPATGQWAWTDPMSAVRGMHSATLLPNGKVLVAGGISANTSRSDAEIYDPSTGHWVATGSLPYACDGHAATMMRNGQVLISGGFARSGGSTQYLSNSAIYQPGTGLWTSAGAMPAARVGHATIMLMDMSQVLVAGGVNSGGPLASAALFEPGTGLWTATGAMSESRSYHSATRLTNSKVLVVGGFDGFFPYIYRTSAELYDTVTGQWSFAGSVPARISHTATLLNDGTVVVAGGSDSPSSHLASAQRYDHATGTWRAGLQPLPQARSKPSATLLANGKVLVAGGTSHASNPAVKLNTSMLYDPVTENWAPGGNLIAARDQHSATLLANGQVLIVGGYVAGAELYDPGTNQTTAAASPATARGRHRATLLANGKVLLSGGENAFGNNPTFADLYDPDSNSWSSGGNMLGNRYSHSATLLPDGRVLVAGGSTGSGTLKSALLYDPSTNLWTATADMNVARMFHSGTLLPNGKVLVAGGTDNNIRIGTAELFDPATGQWAYTSSLPVSRGDHRALLLASGRVMLTGDNTRVDVFDPLSGQWLSTGSLLAYRWDHDAVLLPSSKVMVVGGYNLPGVELYDPGLSYEMVSGRPYVDTVTNPLYPNHALAIGGNSYSFTGYSGPSSGNGSDSASSQPLVQLQRLDNGAISYATPATLSNSTYTSAAFGTLPIGYYRLTMFVNASPSEARLFAVLPTGKPGVPRLVRLFAGKDSLTLEFMPPTADGGLNSVVYSATCSPAGGGAPITTQGSASPLKFTGLAPNTSYSCSLSATNSAGSSTASGLTTATRRAVDLTPLLMLLLD